MEKTQDFNDRFEEANLLLKHRAFDEACKIYSELIAENSSIPELYNNYGLALFYLDRYDEAIEKFSKAIELKNDFSLPYANIGLVYLNSGEYEKAVSYFKKALEFDPQNPETHYNLAVTYFRIDMKNEAIVHYEDFLKFSGDEYKNLKESVRKIVAELREAQKSEETAQG